MARHRRDRGSTAHLTPFLHQVSRLPGRSRFAAAPVVAVAVGIVAILVALAGRYGYHRDELYFLEAGRHLAWGYPDQPPLTPLIARLADAVAPGSLVALRLPSALAAGTVALLTGIMARDLGGQRAAQVLAALAMGLGAVVLAVGHLLSTATFDLLAWVVVLFLVVRILRGGDERLWLAVGVAAGVGLLNKWLPAFLLGGLAVGLLATPSARPHLRSRWLWAGGAVALALWLPNLVWQASNGWPQLEISSDLRSEEGTLGGRIEYLAFQLVFISPLATVLWMVGLAALLRRPQLAAFRPLAWAYLALLATFLVAGGKHYYLAPMYAPLIAAGAVVLERRLRPAATTAITVAAVVVAAIGAPIALPVLPPSTLADSPWAGPGEDALETIGWPRFVDTIARVINRLPPGQRERAVIFTRNYGEAGALRRFGRDRGLPPGYSGHNGFEAWGPPPQQARPAVVPGFPPGRLDDDFRGCRQAAIVDNGEGVDNEEQGAAIYVCDAPRVGWSAAWPRLAHLDG